MKLTAYEKFIEDNRGAYFNHEAFLKAKDRSMSELSLRKDKNPYSDGGVGILSEKTIHATLKNYLEEDKDYQEVALEGFFADICRDGVIYEVQTRAFDKLRRKLDAFLNYYPVTIVYPMAVNKWISYIDKETNMAGAFRKSPSHMSEYDVFVELYKIKSRLKNPNLQIHLYMLDVEEYKISRPNKARRKSRFAKEYTSYDRVPLGIRKIIELDSPRDYLCFLPLELGDEFISADLAKEAKISKSLASLALNIMTDIGLVIRVGKRGRSYLYKIVEDL